MELDTEDPSYLLYPSFSPFSPQAIVSPLAPKSGRFQVLLTILSIWLVSGILASPAGVYSQEVDVRRLVILKEGGKNIRNLIIQ